MAYLMGIDVGTTGTKALLIDEQGRVHARATIEYPLSHPRPGWAEQNPEDWWNATADTIKRLLFISKVYSRDIKGIGLSGQMHGSVFLDKSCQVIRPAILWCDQRTHDECEGITSKAGGIKRLISLVSNPALTGFTAPKILWLKKHEAKNYSRIFKILLPKDYVRFRLTGEFATEVSDASGTLLLDINKRKWSDALLKKLRIRKEWLPQVFESTVISGKITRQAADLTGLSEGTPVVGGGGDQAAGAVGNGIVKPGVISATIGTSGVVFAHSEKPKVDPEGRLHAFCHAVPGKWHLMGAMLSAGGSFRWFRDVLGETEVQKAHERGIDPYEVLTEEAASAPVGSEGLIFLPYMMGERAPYADPYAKGVFFGLSMRHGKSHLIRAVMEGVTFGMNDSLQLIRKFNIQVGEIRASGGGARSRLWRQMQADIYNHPVVTINIDEGPAFGVALLAGVGTGIYKSVKEACDATIQVTDKVTPIRKNVKTYSELYEIYQSLYPALKDNFSKVSQLTIS